MYLTQSIGTVGEFQYKNETTMVNVGRVALYYFSKSESFPVKQFANVMGGIYMQLQRIHQIINIVHTYVSMYNYLIMHYIPLPVDGRYIHMYTTIIIIVCMIKLSSIHINTDNYTYIIIILCYVKCIVLQRILRSGSLLLVLKK